MSLSPVFDALFGSINIIVEATGVVSSTSVSLAPIVETVTAVSSFVVLFKLSIATGGLLFTVNVAGDVVGASQA